MPQISPINWALISLTLTILLIAFIVLIPEFNTTPDNISVNFPNNPLNW